MSKESKVIRILSQTVPGAALRAVQAIIERDSQAFRDCLHADVVIDDGGQLVTGADAVNGWCLEQFQRTVVALSDVLFVSESPSRTAMRARMPVDGGETPITFTFDDDGVRIVRLQISA